MTTNRDMSDRDLIVTLSLLVTSALIAVLAVYGLWTFIVTVIIPAFGR